MLQEAKQAIELMGKWEMIDVCDALELLSPLFESEEVGLSKIWLVFVGTSFGSSVGTGNCVRYPQILGYFFTMLLTLKVLNYSDI